MFQKKIWSDFSWVLFFILLFILFKLCFFGLYLVPSPSMTPNLLPGDRVFSNKLAYGFTLPFFTNPLFHWSTPKRGDIVVFSFDGQTDLYIKRVIGLPGDFITFQNGQVFVEKNPLSLTKIKDVQEQNELVTLFKEESKILLPHSHNIYLSKNPSWTFFESRRYLVPPHKFFVLGDNRDNSSDSRIYGFVDKNKIKGRVSFVLFSTQGESLWPNFRWDRNFKLVN